MKKITLFATVCLLMLAGCSKEKDLFTITQDDINAAIAKTNAEKVFGVTFDPNQDWNSTISGEVTIQANPSVKKVQVLVNVCEVNDPSAPAYVTRNTMSVLNETETNGQTTIKLNYDAPIDNLGIYVAFITDYGYFVRKVNGNTASLDGTAKSRMTRALSTGYTLPEGSFAIENIYPSYAAERGWVEGEKLYDLSDESYASLKMTSDPEDYSDEFKEEFGAVVFSFFPNGKGHDNLPIVKESGYYNGKVYPITTGDEPIIVTPIYKCDHATQYGNEVYNSDLYYYYFNEQEMGNLPEKKDTIEYLQSLPKFKAIPFNQCFGENEDNEIRKHGSFALLYFGDGIPEEGAVGTFEFPQGYKIGFMVRAKTEFEHGKKQGEVYGDGRLNNDINKADAYNFKSSNLGEDGPRAAWIVVEDKMIMCWESGTDSDFNDIIMEVEGGIEPFIPVGPKKEVFTYCFEDSQNGDYDMNDVVIKATRINKTTVEYSLIACGAYKELCIRNINSDPITDDAEVHALFGLQPNQFINTDASNKRKPITVTKKVNENFSFKDPATQPRIYDKSTGNTIYLATKGQSPYGIMIPNDFKYPYEKVCIKDAYKQFNNWGQHSITSTLWYTDPVEGKIYK